MSISRRELLVGAAVFAVSCTNVTPAAAPTPGVAKKPIAIDMHNHIYPAGTEPHPQHGPGGKGTGGPPPEAAPGPELSLADELARSGFTAVCASFVLDFATNVKPGDARENFLRWLSAVDAELAKGKIHRALTRKDLEAARDRTAPTIVQTVEGAHFIEGDLGRIEEVYGRGLRHLQLLHEKDDMVSPLGDTNTGVAHLGGLTPFGVEVVKQCHRRGIVVDLAHASADTVSAALKISTLPLIISHTNLDTWAGGDSRFATMMKPRLISKEHARVVADAGGAVGIWTKLTKSIPELASSIKAMVDAIGIDHVGIGTDTDLLSSRVGAGTNRAYPDLQKGLFVVIAEELRRQGFSEEDVGKVGGGNYASVFGAVTSGRS